MRKLIITCALAASALTPAIATAADPAPADFKNAAKYCKALKAASGSSFASMFGTKKNAYGKCVSTTAKKTADEDAAQEKTAKTNAAKECKAEKTKGSKNAFGKCVSEKAKAKKDAADAEDKAEQKDRINAAKTCKQAKKDDAEQFEKDYGSRRNAFGKCVSKTAKELAAARKDS
jgi:hypothetical protein